MAQGASRRHLNAETWVQFEDIPSRICDGKKIWRCKFFISLLRFCPVSTIPYTLCIHLHLMSLKAEKQSL